MKKTVCVTREIRKRRKSLFTIIFYISLIYYMIWLVLSIIFAIKGVDSGWAMPAMSNGELVYGWEAFNSGIVIGILATSAFFWWIPLYQIIYLAVMLVKKVVEKHRQKKAEQKIVNVNLNMVK